MAKDVSPKSGNPDFKQPQKDVKGGNVKVPSSGTNDFKDGQKMANGYIPFGQKTVKSGGGDASEQTDAYKTIRKAQDGKSDF